MKSKRDTYCWEDGQRAGCFTCQPDGHCIWTGPNALAVAARHHDATAHPTWFEAVKIVRYGVRERSGA